MHASECKAPSTGWKRTVLRLLVTIISKACRAFGFRILGQMLDCQEPTEPAPAQPELHKLSLKQLTLIYLLPSIAIDAILLLPDCRKHQPSTRLIPSHGHPPRRVPATIGIGHGHHGTGSGSCFSAGKNMRQPES